MEQILITGANGNVGQALLRHFAPGPDQRLFTAVRNDQPGTHERFFDFTDPATARAALRDIDVLFLLRPPQLSQVDRYFAPLIATARDQGVRHIVFLSVQGAEEQSFIPHAKIERLLRESGLDYTFLRPSYFMQNLTTTLREDIRQRNRIFLPAGTVPFLWIDADDIGRAAAVILRDSRVHAGQAYTLTGSEHIAFPAVAELLSQTLGRRIDYPAPGPLRFLWQRLRTGHPPGLTLVMLALHYLPRFQKPPAISPDLPRLTGQPARRLGEFIREHAAVWR
jgi:uncharacterized protein YbjT (DUF2867 family)